MAWRRSFSASSRSAIARASFSSSESRRRTPSIASPTLPAALSRGPSTNPTCPERITRDLVLSQTQIAIDLIDSRRADVAVSDGLGAPAFGLLLYLPQTVLDDEPKVRGVAVGLSAIVRLAPLFSAMVGEAIPFM